MTTLNTRYRVANLSTRTAVRNLRRAVDEERLVPGTWNTEREGKKLGCLLACLGGEEAYIDSVDVCPASLMPRWLAIWTVSAFDSLNKTDIYNAARDYAQALLATDGWGVEKWEKMRVEFICAILDQAIEHSRTRSGNSYLVVASIKACETVKSALRSGSGMGEAQREASGVLRQCYESSPEYYASGAAFYAAGADVLAASSRAANLASCVTGNPEGFRDARRKQFALLVEVAKKVGSQQLEGGVPCESSSCSAT